MPTSEDLQNLYSLGTSFPDFSRQLYRLIRHDERERYLTTLRGSELARLVDFLDQVRAVPSAFHQFTNQISQALSVISTTDDAARVCLRKLQSICGRHATLPSSYIISGEIARVGDSPIALGAIADVWEGTHESKKVSIKCLRVPLTDNKSLKKVRVLRGASNPICSRTPVGLAVILQRGRHVQKVKPPEHRPFHRRHNRSFTNRLGVDAERNPDGVYREKSNRESDWPGESPSL